MFIKHERFYPVHRTVVVGGKDVVVPPFALLAWASLTRRDLPKCPAGSKRFPVVIDTAFSHNLLLREDQARDWAGLSITFSSADPWNGTVADASGYLLRRRENCTFEGVTGTTIACPAFDADLWLHTKQTGGKSMQLELPNGFTFPLAPRKPGDGPGPSLPLLGGRALYVNDVKLVVDYMGLVYSLGQQV